MTTNRLSNDIPSFPNQHHGSRTPGWGSDFVAHQLSQLQIPYMPLVPGSSYRGLHDSLVNFNGNKSPELLVCLHEEHAVAIAHGYAKVTGNPLAVGLHANVGLMHASMAIYNAFCDRIPMLLIGATGPVDATKRRPWIDWIHTAADQGALIRNYTKWDDQPASIPATVKSIVSAAAITRAKPCAPTYVCLDLGLQESKCNPASVQFPNTERYLDQAFARPAQCDLQRVLTALKSSKKILFMLGRMNRTPESWNERIELAELVSARVLTDIKQAATFPTTHKLHPVAPGLFLNASAKSLIDEADLIVAFEWIDVAGALASALPSGEPNGTVVQITNDSALHNGWSKDHFDQVPADIKIVSDADSFLTELLTATKNDGFEFTSSWPSHSEASSSIKPPISDDNPIFIADLASALYSALPPSEHCLISVPLSFRGTDLITSHPLSFLGYDGGAGVGSGPGKAVGVALALKPTELIPVAILGDGDYLMASSALWTASRYRIPLLVIVANNASYYNDEVHQERVAKARERPIENKWIGMRIDDPLPDLSKNAESFGARSLGRQIKTRREINEALQRAVEMVRERQGPVVVDVKVLPDDYGNSFDGKGSG